LRTTGSLRTRCAGRSLALNLALSLSLGLPLTLRLALGLPLRVSRCLPLGLRLPGLGRFLRLASVLSPPGTPRAEVIGPLAQSATAMHISTRLLF